MPEIKLSKELWEQRILEWVEREKMFVPCKKCGSPVLSRIGRCCAYCGQQLSEKDEK